MQKCVDMENLVWYRLNMETREKTEMKNTRYKVVERWGGWKIWDMATDVIGTVTYPTKEMAENLAKSWETRDDDDIEE